MTSLQPFCETLIYRRVEGLRAQIVVQRYCGVTEFPVGGIRGVHTVTDGECRLRKNRNVPYAHGRTHSFFPYRKTGNSGIPRFRHQKGGYKLFRIREPVGYLADHIGYVSHWLLYQSRFDQFRAKRETGGA